MKKKYTQCYEILLTYRCNSNCYFCSQGNFNKLKDTPFDVIIKQIYKARKEGYTKLGLSGGEPTLREDLVEIIRIAKKIGFDFIRIQTNGIRLKDFKLCKKLTEAGLTFCKFSFISHDPNIHNMLTRHPLSWQNAMKGLENMKKLKVRLGNNILINKYNYKNIRKTISFLLQKGISNFVIIYPIYTGNMYINRDIGISLNSCKKYLIDIANFMEKNNMLEEILFLNVPACFLEKYHTRTIGLSPFNTLVTTPEGITIDLDRSSNQVKIKSKICKLCIFNRNCKGVDSKYIEIFGWTGFKSINEKILDDSKNEKHLTNNEKCLIEILKIKNNVGIKDIIKLAKRIPLCYDCSDINNIMITAMKLVSKKIIKAEFINGKYYFKFLK